MSISPPDSIFNTRSRHPRPPTAQAELDSAIAWLSDPNRTAVTCPTQAVTNSINISTSIGRIILVKYDPEKLTTLYTEMRKLERVYMVEELRIDVDARTRDYQLWREVASMAVRQIAAQNGERVGSWRALDQACERAVGVMQELRERLMWCEREFETERPPEIGSLDERVWYEGGDVGVWEQARGRALERD